MALGFGRPLKTESQYQPTCGISMTGPTRLFFFLRRSFPFPCPSSGGLHFNLKRIHRGYARYATTTNTTNFSASLRIKSNGTDRKNKKDKRTCTVGAAAAESVSFAKKRTRSRIDFDRELIGGYDGSSCSSHVPVMLGEVLDVFAGRPGRPLCSFVDCTVGAAGHSSAIIQAHPELRLYFGLDIDPMAHEKAQGHIRFILDKGSNGTASDLRVYNLLKNFKDIKSVLTEVDYQLPIHGVDGILMDLGMSSMQVNNPDRGFSLAGNGPLDMRMNPQATLKAEDILNSWPESEVGRIFREYGEEPNWHLLQAKIAKARLSGGLHSTEDLVNLVQSVSRKGGGRRGWIKTATRVFQALRIAVNDELGTLKYSLYACFDCLSSGGRLAVISFHSLEDRIVKQTFLDLIGMGHVFGCGERSCVLREDNNGDEEAWIKQKIHGRYGTILTKRPITPSYEEERLNRRSRSAKLRVIQKAGKNEHSS